jgi:mannan endo-1,4-beta-mannosidase
VRLPRTSTRLLLVLSALVAIAVGIASPGSSRTDPFVTRSGTSLRLAGKPFRFGGANIEWLGLAGYGPADPAGPHYPSHYEIDDALATAKEMGARVIRSQTMGDSVGCDLCLEPAPGQFNPAAFERIDYALRSARALGLKVIPTVVGDDAQAGGTGCVYLGWRGISVPGCSLVNMEPFWSDPGVVAEVEAHIKALLDHVNVYTGVRYRDDPTILGWDLLNGGGSPTPWTRQIARYVRSLDRNHLILSGAANVRLSAVDACVSFVYPHWSLPLSYVRNWIDACRAAGKPYIVYEYGWDTTNYPTQPSLRGFLAALRADPEIAGDAFWALQAHADGHGWMPIPAGTSDPATARTGESGEWWAMYYTGIKTLVMSGADMAARAQIIRAHNYAMAGLPRPRHAIPPPSTVTAVVRSTTPAGLRIYWRGAAGARDYSVQRAPTARGPWTTLCTRCVTDLDDGFVDGRPRPGRSWYRVIPYNLDGRAGPASKARPAPAP